MPKINPWQAIVALAILISVPVVLVLTGHKTDLGFVVAGAGSLILAVLNVFKQQPDPSPAAAKVPPLPVFVLLTLAIAALLLGLASCTPKQETSITKTVADVAACINQQAANPAATPEQIAITCGLEAAPDIVEVIGTIAAKKRGQQCTTITVSYDAGAPAVGK